MSTEFEENKEVLFPQERIMRVQTERQRQPLNEQRQLHEEFKKLESSSLNKLILADTFSKQSAEFSNWEYATFHVGGVGVDSTAEIKGNWMPANFSPSLHGLQTRYIILRSRSALQLKSIACEVRMSIRLVGDSTFWIITRAAGVKDPAGMVCKVRKEQDTQRVFLIFGGHVGANNEFKFFKKQEFPEIAEANEEALTHDYVDLKMTLIDNGDDKVFVSASTSNRRIVSMSCNKFIPNFRDNSLLLAGSGDSVLLKNISVRQIERVDSAIRSTGHYECCNLL